jgi:hypothetical protein
MNTNHKSAKKEEIVLRAIQILTTHLTETNGFQKIKEIVCNNHSNNNSSEKSKKIFNIIFSSDSVNALIQNMKLTGAAKSGIGIFEASKRVSSLFSFSRKTKTTMRRKITSRKTTTSRSRLNDPMVSQVDTYLKPESLPIIERAIEPLMKSCSSADFVNVVRSQCIEPVIKRVASGTDVENYFSGGGIRKMASSSSQMCRTRSRSRS